VQKTKVSTLVWTALIATPIGWSLSQIIDVWSGALPPIPWVLPFLLLFLSIGAFAGARAVRQWIEERRYYRCIDPLRVARAVALAKAMAYFGAVATGLYAGLGALALTMLQSPMGRERAILAAGVVVCAVAMTTAAIRLERACVVPPDDTDENGVNGAKG